MSIRLFCYLRVQSTSVFALKSIEKAIKMWKHLQSDFNFFFLSIFFPASNFILLPANVFFFCLCLLSLSGNFIIYLVLLVYSLPSQLFISLFSPSVRLPESFKNHINIHISSHNATDWNFWNMMNSCKGHFSYSMSITFLVC